MMLRIALCMSVAFAVATPAFAQFDGCRPGLTGVTSRVYIETHRPVVVKRKLSAEESKEARQLMAQIKKTPDASLLERLAVFAASGDREMMKVMMKGYGGEPYIDIVDEMEQLRPAAMALAGLWAMHLWRDGERSKDVSKALTDCLELKGIGKVAGYCGFDADFGTDESQDTFKDHWSGKTGPPKKVTFTERSVAQTREQEVARFEKAYKEYVSGQTAKDYAWAYCWAKRQHSGEYVAKWDGSAGIASDNYSAGIARAEEYKKAEIDRKAAEWTALQNKRVAARQAGGKLSESDESMWASLSFWLGGKYLLPFASENVLIAETSIQSLCAADSGTVCQRQQQLFQARSESARVEQNMKDAQLRNLTLGGSTVTVRNYDQSGNYLGTVKMPAWQADVLGAN